MNGFTPVLQSERIRLESCSPPHDEGFRMREVCAKLLLSHIPGFLSPCDLNPESYQYYGDVIGFMAKNDTKTEKTNVMRLLELANVSYRFHNYSQTGETNGEKIAAILGEEPERVFKTLVTVAPNGEHFVFVIPVCNELDLKKAAKSAGVKSIAMLKQKDLLPLTGYVHGGCSPIGMKKFFPTFIDETAQLFDTVYFSAGKIGYQVEVSPADLIKMFPFSYADLTV